MRCKHCGIGLDYYSSVDHSERKSCMVSEQGYHYFVTDSYYFIYTVYSFCCKKSNHADCSMQIPIRVPNNDDTR